MGDINRKIICVTPVKNEEWIIRSFLSVVSTWADYIIVSDNGSTDNSREIAKSFPKVILLENNQMTDFDEYQMRKPLIDEARKIEGERVIVSLDADEAIPNINGEEWNKIINLPKGTIIQMRFLNLLPGFNTYFEGDYTDVVYIDDGAPICKGGAIHDTRLKIQSQHKYISTLGFFHFQFVDWARMESKHRWYQCYERINFPNKNPLDIYRRYHWMYSPKIRYCKIPNEWKEDYLRRGGQQFFLPQDSYPWDEKIYRYFQQYGTNYFLYVDIWDYSWSESPHRGLPSRLFLSYLHITTKSYYKYPLVVRYTDLFVKGLYRMFIEKRNKV